MSKILELEVPQEAVAVPVAPRKGRNSILMSILAVAVGMAAIGVAVLVGSGTDTSTGDLISGRSSELAPDLRSEQAILADLAAQGYIPSGAVDWRLLKTEELVNQGLIPAETLNAYVPSGLTRAQRAEADRWTAMAVASLPSVFSPAQQAEADRLTGLAEAMTEAGN